MQCRSTVPSMHFTNGNYARYATDSKKPAASSKAQTRIIAIAIVALWTEPIGHRQCRGAVDRYLFSHQAIFHDQIARHAGEAVRAFDRIVDDIDHRTFG